MKERPLPFSGPMVRAILDGRKTQTRRIVKHQPVQSRTDPTVWGWYGEDGFLIPTRDADGDEGPTCPYGIPGDRLWVREPWRTLAAMDKWNATEIAAKCIDAGWKVPWAPVQFEADNTRLSWTDFPKDDPGRYRHGRFMPRWASRITLEVVAIRVERLQDITNDDCIAEGIDTSFQERLSSPKNSYYYLWDQINGAGAWDKNPWVWVVEFKRT